ncbi:MAG: ABC transporter ATP-binding protein [Clostridia bacterium]|nr:ABC transporter ATP-binding protein [Clostridia bacterium]
MIKIENLNKKYGEKKVFENFSLEIEKGKITCILGESGCGKTTLLNVLSRLTDFEGRVDEVNCSLVFQTPNLFPNLTAKQNLLLVSNDLKKIDALSNELSVADKLNSYPKHLSGGEAQRISLIRGIIFDADLLLMDEPFSSLDLGVKFRTITALKKRFKEEKKTVVMVTHDVKEAVEMADRIILLSGGKIVYDNKNLTKKTENELFGLLIGTNN